MYQVLFLGAIYAKGLCFWARVPKAGYKESVRIYITNDCGREKALGTRLWYHSCSFVRSYEVLHKEIKGIKLPAPVKDITYLTGDQLLQKDYSILSP